MTSMTSQYIYGSRNLKDRHFQQPCGCLPISLFIMILIFKHTHPWTVCQYFFTTAVLNGLLNAFFRGDVTSCRKSYEASMYTSTWVLRLQNKYHLIQLHLFIVVLYKNSTGDRWICHLQAFTYMALFSGQTDVATYCILTECLHGNTKRISIWVSPKY